MKWLVTLGASLHAVVTILMTSSLAGGRLLEKRNKATRPSNRSIEQSQRTKRNRRRRSPHLPFRGLQDSQAAGLGQICRSSEASVRDRQRAAERVSVSASVIASGQTVSTIIRPARQDCETGSDTLPDRTTDH